MRFVTQPLQLTIKFEGFEIVWALKHRLQIPRYAIQEVDFTAHQPVLRDFKGYWRIPGTAVPGTFAAGSYRREGEREFWYLRLKTPGVLTIILKPNALNYDKIRITTTPEIAQDIADWWRTEPAS